MWTSCNSYKKAAKNSAVGSLRQDTTILAGKPKGEGRKKAQAGQQSHSGTKRFVSRPCIRINGGQGAGTASMVDVAKGGTVPLSDGL